MVQPSRCQESTLANKTVKTIQLLAISAEEYYRRSMYFPYLDVCLEQLRERFTAHPATVYGLSSLLPAHVIDADISNLRAAAEAYECFLPEDAECFEAELMRWKAYWARQPSDCRPENVLNSLKTAGQLMTYSITETLLQIFATLPVTTATGERSPSALKLIKTYLRTSMQKNRLNALAFWYINNNIKLDYSYQFAKGNRRLNLK